MLGAREEEEGSKTVCQIETEWKKLKERYKKKEERDWQEDETDTLPLGRWEVQTCSNASQIK